MTEQKTKAAAEQLRELRSGLGIIEWGAPEAEMVYILMLGAILTPNA